MADDHSPEKPAASTDVRWALGVFAVSVAVFLPTLPYPFLNWDDHGYVVYNPWLYDLTWERVFLPFRRPLVGAWTPLPVLAHLLVFQIAGLEPAAYRALNILCHGAAMAGAFALMRVLGARAAVAAGLAMLVGVHPLRTESVAWISELKDALCNALYVWALWRWSSAGDSAARRGVALLLYALALMSKPMAVSFPLVVLLHDVLLERPCVRRRLAWYAVMFALGIAAATVNMKAQERAIASVELVERVKMAAYGPVHYARLTAWPFDLSPLYPRDLRPTLRPVPSILGFAACAGLLVAAVACARNRPATAFGLLAAGAAYAPVSGIVAFSFFFAADRFSYLPTVLLVAGLAPPLSAWAASGGRRKCAGLAWLVAFPFFAVSTVTLSPAWSSDEALWNRVLRVYPGSGEATQFRALDSAGASNEGGAATPGQTLEGGWARGREAMDAGNYDLAAAEFLTMANRRAGMLNAIAAYRRAGRRSDVVATVDSLLVLDADLAAREFARVAEALAWAGNVERARSILASIDEPTFGAAAARGLLARSALEQGRGDQAIADAREALRQIPGTEDAVYVIGRCAAGTGKPPDADVLLRKAISHPASQERARRIGMAWLGALSAKGGRHEAAAEHFRDAFALEGLDAWSADEISFLGWNAEEVGQRAAAMDLYDLALAKNDRDRTALQNLAILHASQGAFAKAIALMERAVVLWPDDQTMAANLGRMKADAAKAPAP